MKALWLGVALAGVAVFLACSGSASDRIDTPDETADAPLGRAETRIGDDMPDGDIRSDRDISQIREVMVGPARAECYGPFRRMCLMVGGGFFYDEIDGFEHEPGYEYHLRIERYDAYPGQKEPPQDAGRYGYRLLEVISKTPAERTVSEAVVAPARVQCPRTDQTCLLVDGQPFPDSIDGFEYEPGHDYRVSLESYGAGTHRLMAVIDKSPASGTVEEITVGPWRVQCYKNAPITAACIVVNGEPFFGTIEGFARGHGYDYRLRVEKYDLLPGQPVPPPEMPKYGYRLLEVLSETPAKEPPTSN